MSKATASRLCLSLLGLSIALPLTPAVALPPPDDIPEEVLRTQIVLEGRSPEDGELLSAREYAEQDAATDANLNAPGIVTGQIAQLVTLLRIRKALRFVLPIIP
ncbi:MULTISPECIES: hypothetical protein [unclassified Leptolyngbya]|uniref:hypothetical protein n=1 Tax=unclassified Leptolyngbya TaxID=2650499 RepID=UPI00168412DF|nr:MULTISPECIES: hypothetical protein [unclassified Leptolyngbya]MBD1913834.1 hypothetical protein [Leptolyngbya sp. FACHB-8]MBD2157344.1 hypothetical protein [Leptolyngbya sp. FACHB-16]